MPGPYSTTFPERSVVHLVQKGYLEIRPDGSIWRIRHGGTHQPMTPRRIDYVGVRTKHRHLRIWYYGELLGPQAHRLVWQWHHGDIPEDMVINHKDGDPSNNCIDNLELMTQSENQRHSFKVLGHKGSLTLIRDQYEALVQAAREAVATGDLGGLGVALQVFDVGTAKWKNKTGPRS